MLVRSLKEKKNIKIEKTAFYKITVGPWFDPIVISEFLYIDLFTLFWNIYEIFAMNIKQTKMFGQYPQLILICDLSNFKGFLNHHMYFIIF